MVKGKGKGKVRQDAKVRERPWPIVTSDVCEHCPIQCPKGIAYMEAMRVGGKPGFGVVCKKELYLKRKAEGKHPFEKIPNLYRAKRDGVDVATVKSTGSV
jgi:hypothetical protein